MIGVPNVTGHQAATLDSPPAIGPASPLGQIGLFFAARNVDDRTVAPRLEAGQPMRRVFRLHQPTTVRERSAVLREED